jgi:hypothetical protein
VRGIGVWRDGLGLRRCFWLCFGYDTLLLVLRETDKVREGEDGEEIGRMNDC